MPKARLIKHITPKVVIHINGPNVSKHTGNTDPRIKNIIQYSEMASARQVCLIFFGKIS